MQSALGFMHNALSTQRFRYLIRADIKSYYASIDHRILIQQIKTHFQDLRVCQYLEAIVTIPINYQGNILLPKQGIPRRSSLSPFFGALYLSPLDRAFENKSGICYIRYMDDILILAETKRQFLQAKRRLKNILAQLKLTLSRRKTRMGKLYDAFHFLGVQVGVAQTHQPQSQVAVTIHKRSCRRALERVRAIDRRCCSSSRSSALLVPLGILVGPHPVST